MGVGSADTSMQLPIPSVTHCQCLTPKPQIPHSHFLQTCWLTLLPVYNQFPISVKVELLSGMLYEEHPDVAPSQPTLRQDSYSLWGNQ